MNRLKGFDSFAKTIDDFRIKTYGGAFLTIVCTVAIAVLIVSEFAAYREVRIRAELVVDTARAEKLPINFNITFPRLPCHAIAVDVMDVAGEHQSDIVHDISKIRLSKDGRRLSDAMEAGLGDSSGEGGGAAAAATTAEVAAVTQDECGSCYGALPEGVCCNTCEDVRKAYQKKGWSFPQPPVGIKQCAQGTEFYAKGQADEGCNIYGHVQVNKVAGNFHMAPGRSFEQNHMHMHDINGVAGSIGKMDLSHAIHRLSFGKDFPNIVNPLDGIEKDVSKQAPTMFQYYVKVVPTQYTYLNGTILDTNQFSVTQHEKNVFNQGVPGVSVNFDISPMLVIYTQEQSSFFSFLTGVCAIVGGIYTIASIVDSLVYSAEKTLRKKVEIGKAT